MRIYSIYCIFFCTFIVTLTCAGKDTPTQHSPSFSKRTLSDGNDGLAAPKDGSPHAHSTGSESPSQESSSHESPPHVSYLPTENRASRRHHSLRSNPQRRMTRSNSGSSTSSVSSSYSGERIRPLASRGSFGVYNSQSYLDSVGSINTASGLIMMTAGAASAVGHPIAGLYSGTHHALKGNVEGGKAVVEKVVNGVKEGCSMIKDGACLAAKGFRQSYKSNTPERAYAFAPRPKRKYGSWNYQAGKEYERSIQKTAHRARKAHRSVQDTATSHRQ